MPTTSNRALRYPAPTAGPNVPQDIQNLATDVDNALALIFGKMWRTSGASGSLTVGTETVVAMDVARVVGGVTFNNAADSLTLPVDGLYDIDACMYLTGAATGQVETYVRRTRASVADLVTAQGPWAYKPSSTTDSRAFWSHKAVPLKAGDVLKLAVKAVDSSLQFYGANEYNGVFLTVTYVAPLAGATPV